MNTPSDDPLPPRDPPQQGTTACFDRPRGKLSLWTGVLAGPIAWSIQLQAGYALSRFSHAHPWLTGAHHAVSASFLLVTLGALFLAWRDWRRVGRGQPPGAEGGIFRRSRFMAVLGMFTSALFALVILAQWIPVFFVDPAIY